MSDFAPVPIPRWRWRSFAADLSWLFRPLTAREGGTFRHVEETHLVCLHSTHHAWIAEETLELAWRKEIAPEGFELWDTLLRARPPFRPASVARLFNAWGLAEPESAIEVPSVADLLAGPIAGAPAVRAVPLVRRCRRVEFQGIECSLETLVLEGTTRLQSFAIEHEDPSLMTQVLADLGLDSRDHVSFLQGLRGALGLPMTDPGSRTWPRKSNASIS